MSPTILCSTGAITRGPDYTDHNAILQHASTLGTTAFELVFYDTWYGHRDDVVADLRSSELTFPVVHADKSIGRGLGSEDADEAGDALARLDVNCGAAAALGAETVVLHLWELPKSDTAIERNLDRLPTCIDTTAAYNLVLAVETVPGMARTSLENIKLALDRDSRCRVALDTEFLAYHGQLEESVAADWLWLGRQVCHVHLKDFDGRFGKAVPRHYLLPGEGMLDLESFLDGLRQREYDGAITVEATARTETGELDTARLVEIAAALRELSGS